MANNTEAPAAPVPVRFYLPGHQWEKLVRVALRERRPAPLQAQLVVERWLSRQPESLERPEQEGGRNGRV